MGRSIARTRIIAILAVAVAAAAAGVFIGSRLSPKESAARAGDRSGTRTITGGSSPTELGVVSPGPSVDIASGVEGSSAWALSAHTAVVDGQQDTICFEWSYEEESRASQGCFPGVEAILSDSGVLLISGPGDLTGSARSSFFGITREEVAAVTISEPSGSTLSAKVYDLPSELGLHGKAFVGFAPPREALTLRGLSADGSEVWSRKQTPLPLLSVERNGTGDGTVTAYHAQEVDCPSLDCPSPEPEWIDCGSDCAAAIDGAEVVLRAVPDPQSKFVGWSGACSGAGDCRVVVDHDVSVVATFEAA